MHGHVEMPALSIVMPRTEPMFMGLHSLPVEVRKPCLPWSLRSESCPIPGRSPRHRSCPRFAQHCPTPIFFVASDSAQSRAPPGYLASSLPSGSIRHRSNTNRLYTVYVNTSQRSPVEIGGTPLPSRRSVRRQSMRTPVDLGKHGADLAG